MIDTRKPNIVYITSEECKATAVGCYGNEDAYTPNIDRLSEEGALY
jgi:arylsulfatase A-like enzyme